MLVTKDTRRTIYFRKAISICLLCFVALFYISGLNAALITGIFFAFLLMMMNRFTFSLSVPKKAFFLSLFFFCHIIYSYYLNQTLDVTKYLILYLTLGSLFIISSKNSFKIDENHVSSKNFFNIVLALSLIQIIHYIYVIFSSDAYVGINNIDAQNRKSLGVYPVLLLVSVLFFNREFSSNFLKFLIVPLSIVVPFFVFFNGSRSEFIFLLFALFIGYFSRGRFKLLHDNSKSFFILAIVAIYFLYIFQENSVLNRTFDLNWLPFGNFNLDMANETAVTVGQNFRLHESALIVQKIFDFNLLETLIGCGVGCSVEYPYLLVIGDLSFTSSAVFHNGFLALLLQFGLIGLFISLFIIIRWFKFSWLLISNRARIPFDRLINYLAHSFLTITMLSSGGYTSLISVSILLPLLYLPSDSK